MYPENDEWCEGPWPAQYHSWQAISPQNPQHVQWKRVTVNLDYSDYKVGLCSIRGYANGLYTDLQLDLKLQQPLSLVGATSLNFYYKERCDATTALCLILPCGCPSTFKIYLMKDKNNYAEKLIPIPSRDTWHHRSIPLTIQEWVIHGSFDWTEINTIRWVLPENYFNYNDLRFWIDDLYFVLEAPYVLLCIDSEPAASIPYTINGMGGITGDPPCLYQDPSAQIELTIAATHGNLVFDHWETPWGVEANRTINFTIWEDITVTAHYTGEPPPPPKCSDYTNENDCRNAGCHWYDNACHSTPPSVKCSDYTTKETCEAAGCYWYDNACHKNPKGVIPSPEEWYPGYYIQFLLQQFRGILKK